MFSYIRTILRPRRLSTLYEVPVVGFLCILLSCMASTAFSQSPDNAAAEAVKARATEYWQYKVAGDLEKAYAYEDPETIRDTTLADYVRSFGGGVKWLGAEVDSVTVAGDKAKVNMSIRYVWTFLQGQTDQGLTGSAVEFWLYKDGAWYHKFVNPRKYNGPKFDGGNSQSDAPPNTQQQ